MNIISKNQEKHFIIDILFVLILFGVFTVSALMLVTIGSEVYRHTVDDMGKNYDTRTCISYITEKIRQNDTVVAADSSLTEAHIRIATLTGEPALMLTQDINGEAYCTYLYLYDGYLRELLTKSGSYLGEDTLSAGQKIIELSDFHAEWISENLLTVQLTTTDGEIHKLFVSPHCTVNDTSGKEL